MAHVSTTLRHFLYEEGERWAGVAGVGVTVHLCVGGGGRTKKLKTIAGESNPGQSTP